jgi:hypothetical protein
MPYIGPNSLRKNRINNIRKVCTTSIAYQDIRQPPIGRKREKVFKRNVVLTPQHKY